MTRFSEFFRPGADFSSQFVEIAFNLEPFEAELFTTQNDLFLLDLLWEELEPYAVKQKGVHSAGKKLRVNAIARKMFLSPEEIEQVMISLVQIFERPVAITIWPSLITLPQTHTYWLPDGTGTHKKDAHKDQPVITFSWAANA